MRQRGPRAAPGNGARPRLATDDPFATPVGLGDGGAAALCELLAGERVVDSSSQPSRVSTSSDSAKPVSRHTAAFAATMRCGVRVVETMRGSADGRSA